jgi:hypothetical protein
MGLRRKELEIGARTQEVKTVTQQTWSPKPHELSPTAQHLRDKLLRIIDSDKDLDPAEAFDALISVLGTVILVKAKVVAGGAKRPSKLAGDIATYLVETVELNEGMRRSKRH